MPPPSSPIRRSMVRRSVLSVCRRTSAQDLTKRLGAADRAKLDYYFTALRSLEQKLDIQLQKPAAAAGLHQAGRSRMTDMRAFCAVPMRWRGTMCCAAY